MEQKNENEYQEDKEVEMIGVEVLTEKKKDKDVIRKIRFNTQDFDITYKPTVASEEYRNGIKISGNRQLTIDEIPEKVQQIAKKIQQSGSCAVVVNYGLFHTEDREGEPVTYRYIRFPSQLEKWRVL